MAKCFTESLPRPPDPLDPASLMSLGSQIVHLLLLAIPVACIAWTVTHEEVFRELREWCLNKSTGCRYLWQRKFFFLFTCEYCLSHYIAIGVLFVTRFTMLYDDWRGYVIAGFSLVWVANVYMSLFGRLRLDIRHERVNIEAKEAEVENQTK